MILNIKITDKEYNMLSKGLTEQMLKTNTTFDKVNELRDLRKKLLDCLLSNLENKTLLK
jgi:hypothetical protein